MHESNFKLGLFRKGTFLELKSSNETLANGPTKCAANTFVQLMKVPQGLES